MNVGEDRAFLDYAHVDKSPIIDIIAQEILVVSLENISNPGLITCDLIYQMEHVDGVSPVLVLNGLVEEFCVLITQSKPVDFSLLSDCKVPVFLSFLENSYPVTFHI